MRLFFVVYSLVIHCLCVCCALVLIIELNPALVLPFKAKVAEESRQLWGLVKILKKFRRTGCHGLVAAALIRS